MITHLLRPTNEAIYASFLWYITSNSCVNWGRREQGEKSVNISLSKTNSRKENQRNTTRLENPLLFSLFLEKKINEIQPRKLGKEGKGREIRPHFSLKDEFSKRKSTEYNAFRKPSNYSLSLFLCVCNLLLSFFPVFFKLLPLISSSHRQTILGFRPDRGGCYKWPGR